MSGKYEGSNLAKTINDDFMKIYQLPTTLNRAGTIILVTKARLTLTMEALTGQTALSSRLTS